MAVPRSDSQNVRAEFKTWWYMAKYVDVVFDKSGNNPGSTSICRDCCQILSTRTCTGETQLSATGCDFHRRHPNIPFAIKSQIASLRLREMLRPNMSMALYYLDSGDTDLMDVPWIKQLREENEETKKPRKVYQHGETCLHGSDPKSIVQGRGIEGIYWKRCDGRFRNALGDELGVDRSTNEDEAVDTAAEERDQWQPFGEEEIAEIAWRKRTNQADSDDEDDAKPRRKFHCIVM